MTTARILCLAIAAASLAIPAAAQPDTKPTTPQAMFVALGVDASHFDRLADGRPLDASENDTLLRVLFRLRLFPAVDLERWALPADQLEAAIEKPAASRGSIYRLRGRVTEVEPLAPSADDAQRFELARYFRCRLQLDAPGHVADVYTENVPADWQKGVELNAPVGAFGVFLKLADNSDAHPVLVFAAPRLAWYPDDLLGRLGMDVGLLEAVKDQAPLSEDREAFYQMLAAVGRAKPDELLRQAEKNLPNIRENWRWTNRQGQQLYSVVPLFNEPATQRGRLVELLGAARLVEEIHIDEPDVVARFGFDHYYQVSLFTDDSQGSPLTFCIRELPKGMPYGNLPRYGETVRIAGFFFKTWSYPVSKMAEPAIKPGGTATPQQLSPLLIGRSLTWYPAMKPPPQNTLFSVAIGGLLVALVVVGWLLAWRSRRRESKWLDKMETPPNPDAGLDLDKLGQIPSGNPDFNQIANMDHGPEEHGDRS